ncbi:MAG: lytic transglycosylase domain-containing protein [Deltaproteobacteria bacterium]|nr:lytic transglycosylase domain-containing protein [Deltaproteobacteria bacterium]
MTDPRPLRRCPSAPRAASLLAGALLGCAVGGAAEQASAPPRAKGPASPPAVVASALPAAASATRPAPALPASEPDGTVPWASAVREHDWARADALLGALGAIEREQPELRLVRAVVALALGRHAESEGLLRGLEAKLPLVAEEIRHAYAEAAAEAGPFERAGDLLARSPRGRDLVTAALAYLRAGRIKAARETAERALRGAQKARRRDDEALARAARAAIAIAGAERAVAVADWRWICTSTPSHPKAREALAGLERVPASLPLGERLAALARSTTPDNLAQTLQTLDALAAKLKAERTAIMMARGRALQRVRDYRAAAAAFDAVAALASPLRSEAAYHAAVCAARSGSDEQALARLSEVIRRDPSSPWAERASFRRAELLSQSERPGEAAAAFARYLARFGKGSHGRAALRGQALALLSDGAGEQARQILAALLERAPRDERSGLEQLLGLATHRAGRAQVAERIWTDLLRDKPLTWPALCAHARLAAAGTTALPPLVGEAEPRPYVPLAVSLPAGPELLRSLGLDSAAERMLAGMEQQAALPYPGRESEALCAMYGKLATARRRLQIATRAVSFATLQRAPSGAELWAWHCLYPQPYAELVQREEARHGLPAGLVHAIMRQESGFRAAAVSPAGAVGLMQVIPPTAARAALELGLDPKALDLQRPDQNIRLGAFYAGKLLRMFRGSLPLAVAAYNAGPHAVARWLRAGTERGADLWVARIPYGETRRYVERVLGNLAHYQWIAGGEAAVTRAAVELPAAVDVGEDAY